MSLPQHVIYNVGGTVSIDVLTRPTNATVTITDSAGTALASDQTGTISSVSTTLSAAVSAGATSVTVANATGISSGTVFWIRTPDEKVRAKSISGTTVTLWRPLLQAHANAATVQGTLISYAITAGQANRLFWDGRCQWTINGSVAHYTAVECTRYPLARLATAEDLADIDPLIGVVLESEANVEHMLDVAHDDVLGDIGMKVRARVFTGSQEFARATAFRFLENYYLAQTSEAAERLYLRFRERARYEIDKLLATIPRDDDQDGQAAEPDEQHGMSSVRLLRG